MRSWFKERGRHTKAIGAWWWAVVAALYGTFWALDEVIEKWNPFDLKIWWDAHTTQLPSRWEIWLIGFLLLSIIGIIDGSYRHHKWTLKTLSANHVAERKKIGDELAIAKSEIAGLTERPDIRGDLLVVFWEVYKDDNEISWPKHSRYYIKLRLTNYNDVPCTIDRYSVAVADYYDHKNSGGEGKPSSLGRLSHLTYNYVDEDTEVVETSTTRDTWTRVKPINITTQWPLARGRKQEGWVTFNVWKYRPQSVKPDDLAPETFLGSWQECISVFVVDSLGNTHTITNVIADVAPARFERKDHRSHCVR
jgi:hypothetical protein